MGKLSTRIGQKPTTFRGTLAKGLASGSEIDPEGGQYGAGLIPGFAVITRGEALGHEMWVDQAFVASVGEALKAESVKSRYTHPDMSSDGLAKSLGRVMFSGVEGDIVRGDLNFYETAHKSPDGDLADHVLSLAAEDPEAFGASIVFYHDFKAEEEFRDANLEDYEFTDRRGNVRTGKRFKSPDPLNTRNLPHCRLKSLNGCDIVGDPAANPEGLFSRDSVFEEVEAFAEYLFGESEEAPVNKSFDVDPERAKSFLSRFLKSKGLSIVKSQKELDDTPTVDDAPETPDTTPETPDTPDTAPETPQEKPSETPEEPTETPDEPAGELSAGQKEAARYVDAFGDKGGVYFAEGLTFEQASTKHIASLNATIDKQAKDLESYKSASDNPVDLGDAPSDQPAKRKGLAAKLEEKNAKS